MNKIFNMDNAVFRAISKVVDCIYLSMIFMVTCIPIFTIGASCTALYYTVQKVIRHSRGYVGSEYWHAFKTNFKQGTVMWLICLALGILFYFDINILIQMRDAGYAFGSAYGFFIVLMILLVVWCAYLFPYLARFENKNKVLMKNAALFMLMNLPWSLLIAVMTAVAGVIMYIIPFAIFIIPAVYGLLLNLILERIFRKYMSEEDKAMEDEMNREYKN